MENFWDSKVWGYIILFAVLFGSLLAGNVLKKSIPILKNSLIPTSVLGGALLLIASSVFEVITEKELFNTMLFGGNGMATLETVTYHTLALGFIASSLKTSKGKLNKQRTSEIFNTGVTTVSTYLLQGIFGLGITIIAAMVVKGFFSAAGVLLPFGYGQGTGQAMNYGNIYETEYGFINGKSFGLTIAALGFISASLGGVVHLNIMKKMGKLKNTRNDDSLVTAEEVEAVGEIPMQESIDKLTVQVALIFASYMLSYLVMALLSVLLPGMKSTIWGFNFLLGVISASLVKWTMNLFKRMATVVFVGALSMPGLLSGPRRPWLCGLLLPAIPETTIDVPIFLRPVSSSSVPQSIGPAYSVFTVFSSSITGAFVASAGFSEVSGVDCSVTVVVRTGTYSLCTSVFGATGLKSSTFARRVSPASSASAAGVS